MDKVLLYAPAPTSAGIKLSLLVEASWEDVVVLSAITVS